MNKGNLLLVVFTLNFLAVPLMAQEPVPGNISSPSPVLGRETVGTAAQSTVVVINGQPEPSKKKLVPTISAEQLRGKKNFVYALADIIWENILLLGVMFAGILIIFALYSREEEESSLEVSE